MPKRQQRKPSPDVAKKRAAAAVDSITVREDGDGRWHVVLPERISEYLRGESGGTLRVVSKPLWQEYKDATAQLEGVERRIGGSARWAVTFYPEGVIL